ncbi:MAG TPA: hypothetical protein VMD02_03880, partial [Candidatus Omnitrophota bacterium]|nr:hypothetical protein [Candidatus Omnitrophota bacterium]
SVIYGVDSDIKSAEKYRNEHVRRLAEVVNVLLSAGLTVIATASDLDENDIESFRIILRGYDMVTVIAGENYFVEKTADIELPAGIAPRAAAEKVTSYYDRLEKK